MSAKYYSILVDAMPDSAHVEQTVFILQYVHLNEESQTYEVQEQFLEFVDCNQKTGEAIAGLNRDVIKIHNIPMTDCRGQGYDNESNMSGQYKGAQAARKDNPIGYPFAVCLSQLKPMWCPCRRMLSRGDNLFWCGTEDV